MFLQECGPREKHKLARGREIEISYPFNDVTAAKTVL